MVLEAPGRVGVVEDAFKRRVFEGGAVDVAGDPVVVEYRGSLYESSVSMSGFRPLSPTKKYEKGVLNILRTISS